MNFDLTEIIKTIGMIGVVAIVFAESGLLIGFFLPGDSLLFTAGFLASQGYLNFPLLLVLCFVAAVAGDSVGYAFGKRVGRKLFQKEDSLLFHKKYLVQAEEFYEKHGGKTIVIARFMPVVRTFAPIVAGMGQMNYRRFLAYNVVGGFFWAVGVTSGGYLLGVLGKQFMNPEDIDKIILPIVIVIVVVSVAPSAWHVLRDEEMRSAIINSIKNIFNRDKAKNEVVPSEVE